ncbi:hypothetical protein [Nonomuraea sp. NPDC049784]|uniref:hypothetical protein n=1 Tax=Nonomuraea sp. NPDC049784 TaxID=3154361 RepID=UPI0034049E9D
MATALYVRIDDALKAQPRPKIGITPTLTNAELVTPAVLSGVPWYWDMAEGASWLMLRWSWLEVVRW